MSVDVAVAVPANAARQQLLACCYAVAGINQHSAMLYQSATDATAQATGSQEERSHSCKYRDAPPLCPLGAAILLVSSHDGAHSSSKQEFSAASNSVRLIYIQSQVLLLWIPAGAVAASATCLRRCCRRALSCAFLRCKSSADDGT